MIYTINNLFKRIKPSQELENKITLWLNHLLVVYAFLIPIHNPSKSSLFFVMLVLFLYRMNFVKYLKDALSNKVVQALLLFYLVWLFGFIYTENIAYAKSSIRKANYLIFPILFLSFMDKRFAYRVISAFVLGMLFSELISYGIRFELLPHELYIKSYQIYKSFLHDPSPFFKHTDHNIGLAITVSLLLYQLLNKKISTMFKIISIFFIITASLNMSFIGSRTGYISYIFLIMLVLLITYKENAKKAIFIGLIITIPISFLAYNYSNMINQRVNQTIVSMDKVLNNDDFSSSIGLRLGSTKYNLEVIKDNFFIGVGTGDYMDAMRANLPDKHKYIGNIYQPHNVYIKTMLQFGIIGLFFMLFIFYRLFTYKDCDEYNKGILIFLTAAIMLFMLPGKFYGYFVLPMFVTLISALMIQKVRDIDYKELDFKMIMNYVALAVVFLIIGITK